MLDFLMIFFMRGKVAFFPTVQCAQCSGKNIVNYHFWSIFLEISRPKTHDFLIFALKISKNVIFGAKLANFAPKIENFKFWRQKNDFYSNLCKNAWFFNDFFKNVIFGAKFANFVPKNTWFSNFRAKIKNKCNLRCKFHAEN